MKLSSYFSCESNYIVKCNILLSQSKFPNSVHSHCYAAMHSYVYGYVCCDVMLSNLINAIL